MRGKSQGKSIHALALLLASVLLTTLPALGEDISVEMDGDLDLRLPEELTLDVALPELALPEPQGAMDLALPEEELQGAQDVADAEDHTSTNTSKPLPVYAPKSYTITLDGNRDVRIMLLDELTLKVPGKGAESWSVADDMIARIDEKSTANDIVVLTRGFGRTKITITLQDGTKYTVSLTIDDPYELKGLSFVRKKETLRVGQDIDLVKYLVKNPVYAYTIVNTFTYATSDKSVAKVSKEGVAQGLSPGKAILTVKTDNGLTAAMDVVVKANRTGSLHGKPNARAVGKLVKNWTLWPKSLELKGDGSIVCNLWLLNDSRGSLTSIKSLDLAVSAKDATGSILIARNTFKKVKVSCAENHWQTVSLTFPAKAVNYPAPDFTQFKAEDLEFQLYNTPIATSTGKRVPFYVGSGIRSGTPATLDNPSKYRALLISENDFYWGYEEGHADWWEHITENMGDVIMMQSMLESVETPDGGKYTVAVQHNTSLSQIRQLIPESFAGADENDVSLFYIATHGRSDDRASERDSGALAMTSQGENYPEQLHLSELRNMLMKVPGKVIVILDSCGSGAAVYDKSAANFSEAAADFNAQAVNVFREADPGLIVQNAVANTGELRVENKFYVLASAAYHEESFGAFDVVAGKYDSSYFTRFLTQGVGKDGNRPADTTYAGNKNGVVDLHELYRYISGAGDFMMHEFNRKIYYQHTQVYPSDVRYPLFK